MGGGITELCTWLSHYKLKCGTNLRLNKPPFLPATSVAGLEDVGRVDGDAMVGVVQRGKVVPGGAKVKSLEIRCVAVGN